MGLAIETNGLRDMDEITFRLVVMYVLWLLATCQFKHKSNEQYQAN